MVVSGCTGNENQRIAELAERQLQRQAEQNRIFGDLQREMQAERAAVSRQRDAMESERRTLAAQRKRDPIVAAVIADVGLLLACLSPLVVCWFLLNRLVDPDDQAVGELLIEDIVMDRPLLTPRQDRNLAIEQRAEENQFAPDSLDLDGAAD